MRKILSIIFLAIIIFLVACSGNTVEPTMDSDVQDFEAITQDGEPITRGDFDGKWWVADFIFTNCTTICLPMTSNMKKLQDKLSDENLENVELVSFSVDPDFDSPEVLTAYAEEHGADLTNWTFLTGYDFETVQDISMNSFKSMLAPPPEGDDQVIHGVSFFLVNPDGEIIKNYDGRKADDMDEIIADLIALQ